MAYEQLYKTLCNEQFGRRRGGLYRSEKTYYAFGNTDTHQKQLDTVEYVKQKNQSLKAEGWSGKKGFKYMGTTSFELAIANPELWNDDNAVREFFQRNDKFAGEKRRR